MGSNYSRERILNKQKYIVMNWNEVPSIEFTQDFKLIQCNSRFDRTIVLDAINVRFDHQGPFMICSESSNKWFLLITCGCDDDFEETLNIIRDILENDVGDTNYLMYVNDLG